MTEQQNTKNYTPKKKRRPSKKAATTRYEKKRKSCRTKSRGIDSRFPTVTFWRFPTLEIFRSLLEGLISVLEEDLEKMREELRDGQDNLRSRRQLRKKRGLLVPNKQKELDKNKANHVMEFKYELDLASVNEDILAMQQKWEMLSKSVNFL
eukprot:TRINITY_DN1667_c0_g1_i4.p1 TRINITY_DN1667_c0_g1~~TRINITY_DN1667_c0_g1_i4.p1  ORF type:complete len:151 (-),score=25.55 TRINITY_DN1667_c0_g1_i4:185-637(-)